jgi:hypothetical protein
LLFGEKNARGEPMVARKSLLHWILAWSVPLAVWFICGAVLLSAPAQAQQSSAQSSTSQTVKEPSIFLDSDFFKEMEKLSRSGNVTYGDRQEPLLEQIALATRYTVQTNLTLIQQNERIIRLLEELNRKRLQER